MRNTFYASSVGFYAGAVLVNAATIVWNYESDWSHILLLTALLIGSWVMDHAGVGGDSADAE